MTPTRKEPDSKWQRFLKGKTTGQRLLVAVGAVAGALLAIGGLLSAVLAIIDRSSGSSDLTSPGVHEVRNQTEQADEFVRLLLKAAGGSPLQLDHRIFAPLGDGHYRLEYACGEPTGCSYVRLETPVDIPGTIAGGVWFQGCWSIAKDGEGYGAGHLDLEMRKQGATCPT